MADKKNVTRREFINRSGKVVAGVGAAALAGPAINVQGANEKVLLGLIGPGRRGRAVSMLALQMSSEQKKPIEFIAVADIFEGWRERAVMEIERNCMRYDIEQEHDVQTYDSHHKLLENKDVDAVLLATPEHLHAEHMLDVIASGKDMYVEKPMVHTIEEGLKVVKAAKTSDCVIQVGTQRRSVPLYNIARDMVKNGEIGDVNYCEGWWFRNWGEDASEPAWQYSIPPEASEDTIDWPKFLGDTPYRPFDAARYFQWRRFWEYSNGIGSDLMVHQMDAINMVMGTGMPKSVVSSGDIYQWEDGRSSCDTWSSVFEYNEKFQANYRSNFSSSLQSFGIRICGRDGTIEVMESGTLKVIPEPENIRRNKELEAKTIYYPEDNTDGNLMVAHFASVKDHFANFIDCIHSRETPNCDVVTGFEGAALSAMAVEAYHKGRRLNWDPDRKVVIPG